MGNVLNHEMITRILRGEGEEDCSDKEIYERDMLMISKADIIVAIYGHSWGQGYEIAYHIANNGEVICLISEKQTSSAMLNGNPFIERIIYNSAHKNYIHKTEVLLKQAVLGMGS